MSYILDALRRADSERVQGTVPGLHAQSVPAGSVDADDGPRRFKAWPWAVGAAFAVLLGLVVWLWSARSVRPDETPSSSADAQAPAGAIAQAVPAGAATPAPAGGPTAPAPQVGAVTPSPAHIAPATPPSPLASPVSANAGAAIKATPPVEPPLANAAQPAQVATTATPATPAATAPARKPAALATAAPHKSASGASPGPSVASKSRPAAPAAAQPQASEPEARVFALNELPDDVRRELPALTIGGSIYSKSAANRMLVINGQVFHEGDELAPALMLEQIKLKGAVLRFKGYRYEMTY